MPYFSKPLEERLCLVKVPQPSQTMLSGGDQPFKHESMGDISHSKPKTIKKANEVNTPVQGMFHHNVNLVIAAPNCPC